MKFATRNVFRFSLSHRNFLRSCLCGSILFLSGCASFSKSIVTEPVTARPVAPQAAAPTNGAIFQTNSYRPLFEDKRGRHVGDTLVVLISETISASNKSHSQAERTGTLTASMPTNFGLPGKSFQGSTLDASSANKFGGKGESSANNDFTGTIAVTVIEELPNGNLVVAGEKQIALEQGSEKIRFSGVVNPTTIGAANTVQSGQIADARMEYRGDGYIHEAQVMGWLARFFLSFLPY
jgi:flagellar L-ring protein FlgH